MSVPVYQRIKNFLRAEIEQGKYPPGELLPTVNRLAEMFSTSRNTSVKAIQDLAREGVINCVQGRGSVVNEARKTGRSWLPRNSNSSSFVPEIGVLLVDFNDITHPYLGRILKGIAAGTAKTPCQLKTLSLGNRDIDQFLASESIDGLIVATSMSQTSLFKLKQLGVPFVLAGNDIFGEELLSVTSDGFTIAMQALTYLHGLGHRRICILAGPYSSRTAPLIHCAFRHAAETLGISADESLFKACDYGERAGYNAFSKVLEAGLAPTAVFAIEDFIALGAIQAAAEKGLKVPDELSVVGAGRMLPEVNMKFRLTTFDLQLEELGMLSLNMVLRAIKGETIKDPKVVIKAELLPGESCGKCTNAGTVAAGEV